MAGGKESARQKMINIMYLVLLAMLALNVSDTILNAFKNIKDSLEVSRDNSNKSVDQILSNYAATKVKEDPANNKPSYDKAVQAKVLADQLNGYIETIQAKFKEAGDGISEETGDFKRRENMDIAQDIMLNKKEGAKLKAMINDTRAKLIALLRDDQKQSVAFSLSAVDPTAKSAERKSWEELNFGEGIPLTAASTILTKIQNDAKTAEAEVIGKILADQPTVILNQFAAVAVAPTSYVIQGQPYTAEVFLTASDSKSGADVSVNGSKLPTKDGKGVYTGSTGAVGVFKWFGTVRVKNNKTGKIDEYRTPEQSYQVAKPSSNVSSDKLNVIYAGIPNPFSVSAAGFPLESVEASASGASMKKTGAGKYNVTADGSQVGKEVTINVTASNAGKSLSLGSQKFRVKAIPAPVAKIGDYAGGNIASVQLKNEDEIKADLSDFPFDVKFRIVSYKVTIIKPRQDAVTIDGNGGSFTGAVRAAMNQVVPNTKVIFERIVSEAPDGRQSVLPSLIFTVNK